MFDAVPDANLGLEWEPCHQLCDLIDPMAQLRTWVPSIFHVHGKDATVYWDVIRRHGVMASCRRAAPPSRLWRQRLDRIISELRRDGFKGAIDIEGWHDPVYRDDLEMTGQARALAFLKECRGGARYVPDAA